MADSQCVPRCGALLCGPGHRLSSLLCRPSIALLGTHLLDLYARIHSLPLSWKHRGHGHLTISWTIPGVKGDNADLPSHGYSTIRFSNEQDGRKGELDRFCSMERGFFFCAVLIMCVDCPVADALSLFLSILSTYLYLPVSRSIR